MHGPGAARQLVSQNRDGKAVQLKLDEVRRGIQGAAQAGDLADERSARRGGEGGEDVDTVSVAAEARSSAGRARRDPSPGGGTLRLERAGSTRDARWP